MTVAKIAKHDGWLDLRASCDLIPVLVREDQTEQSHKVGLRGRVPGPVPKPQEACLPLQIAQLLAIPIIVQDDVVLVGPVKQDHIHSEFGSQVEALNDVVGFGVRSRLNLQCLEHLSERGLRRERNVIA